MTEREQFEAALAANPRWSLIGPLFSAPPAQQPQYEAADMASAAAQGFRAGVASVAQQPHEIEVQCPVCSHTFYAWPGEHKVQQPQAEPTDSMGIPLSCGKPLCSPGDHHPLCKLHKKPQAEAVKDFDAQLREVAKRAIPQQAEAVPPNVTRAGLFSLGQGDTKMCFHAGHTDPETLVLTLTENVTGGPYRAFWAYVGTEVAADAALAAAPKGGM